MPRSWCSRREPQKTVDEQRRRPNLETCPLRYSHDEADRFSARESHPRRGTDPARQRRHRSRIISEDRQALIRHPAFWRYTAFQVPGWIVASIGGWWVHRWFEVPLWVASGVLVVWVIKDYVLFPFLRAAYELDHRLPIEHLVGKTWPGGRRARAGRLHPGARGALEGEMRPRPDDRTRSAG